MKFFRGLRGEDLVDYGTLERERVNLDVYLWRNDADTYHVEDTGSGAAHSPASNSGERRVLRVEDTIPRSFTVDLSQTPEATEEITYEYPPSTSSPMIAAQQEVTESTALLFPTLH